MIVVLIVPTGIGAEIGGHAGDAGPVAKLIGACCDKVILHPNVVNGSDINEMPENALYVEGSILDRFLRGEIELRERLHNRILVAVNSPAQTCSINAVSASRATAGVAAEIVELKTPLLMRGWMEGGLACGEVSGCEELAEQVRGYTFDALAIHTPIDVDRDVALSYFRTGGVNPWGRVEAMASKRIADLINKPVAHAPIENTAPEDEELYDIWSKEAVDPRMAAEAISTCYLHCVLKGLNRAPTIGKGISAADVDFLVTPYGCCGPPHNACLSRGIPIITVRENGTVLHEDPVGRVVENYWEAAGIVMAARAGIAPASVRRPLAATAVYGGA